MPAVHQEATDGEAVRADRRALAARCPARELAGVRGRPTQKLAHGPGRGQRELGTSSQAGVFRGSGDDLDLDAARDPSVRFEGAQDLLHSPGERASDRGLGSETRLELQSRSIDHHTDAAVPPTGGVPRRQQAEVKPASGADAYRVAQG